MSTSISPEETDILRDLINAATGYEIAESWGEDVYLFEFDSFAAEIFLKIRAFDMEGILQKHPSLLNRFLDGG